jgi:DNA-binding CsgD family transcriptional regulator
VGPAAVAERWPLVGRRPELAQFSRAFGAPGCDAFIVHGPPGVGKTRLAEECLQVAERAGRRCGRATASAEAGTVPLAAIAHLLPADPASDEVRASEPFDSVELFARARRAFEDRGGGARFVLMVDDLHLLDVTSATLLRQLLVTRTVFLVGTVRSDRRAGTSVTALWRDDRYHRVDLDHLPRDSVETLLHLALGAPVDGPAAHALWTTSLGNVLFLRELVLGAQQSGSLVDDDGVWRLTRPLSSTPRLNDLVAARVASVGENGRRALELLALCAPLGPHGEAVAASAEVFETLEEAGLVTVTSDGRRRQLGLAHPVHRDVLRHQMPELRRRAMLLEQVGAIERWGGRRREDGLRIATWRLEATGEADVGLLLQAARLAHHAHDYPLMVRLAGAAQAQRPGPEAGVLLGKALYELGSFFEADVELSRAGRLAEGDEHRVAAATVRSANLLWGLCRPDDALAVNRAAHGAAVSGAARDELVAQEAWILVFSGWPGKAREVIELLPRVGAARGSVVRALAGSYAMTLTGFPGVGLDIALRGHEDHLRLGDQLWVDQPASHILAQVLALSEAGRLEEAAEYATAGYREASAEPVPLLQIRFAFHRGRVALLSGRARTARRWFREAASRSEATGFKGPRAIALCGLAVAHGLLGDADAAGKAVLAMDEVRTFGFLRPERGLGRAWWLVASGDTPGARRVLLEAAQDAVASGHLTAASWLLHDVARLGHAAVVAEQLDGLAEACDSELVSARAAHARALTTSDMDALEQAADRLEAIGAFLVAAEAAGAASQAAARTGYARRSSAFATRAAALAGRCEGARTPGLLGSDAVVALTPREREVAAMAAAGVASRDIATRLFLSVRTVNNHLQRVYAKLGITGRQELLGSLDHGESVDQP